MGAEKLCLCKDGCVPFREKKWRQERERSHGVLTFNANGSSGSQVEVKDSNGKTVAVFTPSLSYQYLVVTNDEIVSGQTYTVSIGENYMTVTAE